MKGWRDDEGALPLAQRCLALFHARWRAGTLFTLSVEERAFADVLEAPVLASPEEYLTCAHHAVNHWPPLRTPAEEEARLHGVYGALRAALEMDARHDLRLRASAVGLVFDIAVHIHNDSVAGGTLLRRLQTTCGLSQKEWTALWAVAMRCPGDDHAADAAGVAVFRERAAADVARHGLRRCALPACDAQEPHPKLFKLCGRCRGAAYCCAAHSKEDWKRHKREDGCKAAGEHAA